MKSTPTHCLLVPTYNEADLITGHLDYHTRHFEFDEIIAVDGGSSDGTPEEISGFGDPVTLVETDVAGRGHQLRRGQTQSSSTWIIVLHADTYLPKDFDPAYFEDCGAEWGWFDCRLNDESVIFRIIERAINIRTAIFSSPTGDQAMWMHRELLQQVGGIPQVPIMEDLKLASRLRGRKIGHRIRQPVKTSARKWNEEGVLTVILSMWWFRMAYFMGASPEWIYKQYYDESTDAN